MRLFTSVYLCRKHAHQNSVKVQHSSESLYWFEIIRKLFTFLFVLISGYTNIEMASRGSGSSRYPSAYGHTPSYRSYGSGSTGLAGSGYPSALGTTSTSASATADRLMKDFENDKFFDSSLSSSTSRAFDKYDLGMPSTTGGTTSSKKVASSSYSYSSTR